MNRVTGLDFDRMYAEAADPWGLETSDYEAGKYAATLAQLGTRFYPNAIEVGCAIGVFTPQLATRCARLVALDFSVAAVAMTRRRVSGLDHVEVLVGSFPEQTPAGAWDLVVCSEVLYYLDAPALDEAIAWFADQLADGATVVAAHWRGPGRTEPLRGDDVHDRLVGELGAWHTYDARRERYRLDRFEGAAS
jgi:predicted TPR repeat methyltransferase